SYIKLNHEFKSSAGNIKHTSIGNGPDLILVHGTPFNAIIWTDVVKRLSKNYCLHLLDLPGYGRSDKFEGQDVRLRSFARVVKEFSDHKKLTNPILIGHDFGAASVLGAHLVEELSVKAIAIIDGVILSPWGTPFSRHVQKNEETFANVPEYVHLAVLEAHIKTASSRIIDTDLMNGLLAPWRGEEGQKAYYRQIGQYDYDYTVDLEKLYPTLQVPSLVLWGEEDQWVNISEGRRFHAMLKNSDFEPLPDAGHLSMIDVPNLLSNKLEDWLNQVLR
ncbi:alpha/beta fold hydrolase, partial [Curvivirga aplysinae]|uniref:alpha/beta fold hydrolase n=1 Tax=Curvivirga aplysinae TaxID=2529852 RepID=UPI0012BC834F